MQSTSPISESFTTQDWEEIAARAEAAGDNKSAQIARDKATAGSDVASASGLGSFAKNAVKIVLRYAKDKLPAPIRPYADKILNTLESIDDWAELSIATGLQQQGLDPNTATQVAQYTVQFINTFG